MKLQVFRLLGFFLMGEIGFAQNINSPDLCSLPNPAVVREVSVPDVPEFYFRPILGTNKITYSADSKNYILDLQTGKKTVVPGNFDAFPAPDSKVMFISRNFELYMYILNSARDEVQGQGFSTRVRGYYQSAGVLTKDENKTVYRLMADDQNGFEFTDLVVLNNPIRIDFQASTTRRLCSNIDFLSLPMLAKNGRKLAAFNTASGSTGIYNINTSTGNCTLYKDLGIATGKVDFSADGKHVVYSQEAVTSFSNIPGDAPIWMRRPNESMVANVYLQNLETGATRAITQFVDTSAMYPAFMGQSLRVVVRKHEDVGAKFLVLDPKNAEVRSGNQLRFSQLLRSSRAASLPPRDLLVPLALGSLFLHQCVENGDDWKAESAALLGSYLSKEQCLQFANRWGDSIASAPPSFKALIERFFGNSPGLSFSSLRKLEAKEIFQVCQEIGENKEDLVVDVDVDVDADVETDFGVDVNSDGDGEGANEKGNGGSGLVSPQ